MGKVTPLSRVLNTMLPGFYECRDCGTNRDVPFSTCPACGSDEVATYDL